MSHKKKRKRKHQTNKDCTTTRRQPRTRSSSRHRSIAFSIHPSIASIQLFDQLQVVRYSVFHLTISFPESHSSAYTPDLRISSIPAMETPVQDLTPLLTPYLLHSLITLQRCYWTAPRIF